MIIWSILHKLAGMDWIDVLNALKVSIRAPPSQLAQSLPPAADVIAGYFDAQNRLKKSSTGQLGIFRNGYWGHPQYKLSPEANLMFCPLS